jgi:hypothetical protein
MFAGRFQSAVSGGQHRGNLTRPNVIEAADAKAGLAEKSVTVAMRRVFFVKHRVGRRLEQQNK